MQLSQKCDIWHGDSSNMIFGHAVKKLWLNGIFLWPSVVFHSLLFFLTLSLVFIDFQKFSSFFQVVGLSTFGDDKFLHNTQKKVYFGEKI